MICANCNAEITPQMRFCAYCGTEQKTAPSQPELRQLTVLFCDLVGSTQLAEQLDLEELRDITSAYHEICGRVIDRHEGSIAQYLGDGVLVYFGFPMAHEDDAQRAVRTGLEILEGIAEIAPGIQAQSNVELAARVGIHTGSVVIGQVGSGAKSEQLALGQTPNVAARVQQLAIPGSVIITADTHNLVRNDFEFEPLGPHEFRGVSGSIPVYRASSERGANTTGQRLRDRHLTTLTGRSREMALLIEDWNRAKTYGFTTTVLSGEAGIGKSRIIDSLRRHLEDQSVRFLECVSSPYHQHDALFPIVTLIELTLNFGGDTPADERLRRLEQSLEQSYLLTSENRRLMANLLSIPVEEVEPSTAFPADVVRALTLQTLRSWLISLASQVPVLWVFEDLHWTDSTTLELLDSIISTRPGVPLLALLTHRPEFRLPWAQSSSLRTIEIQPLDTQGSAAMINELLGGRSLPSRVMSDLIARTGGVPLFVEEMTKAMLESGLFDQQENIHELDDTLTQHLIPATIQSSLMARLDRLRESKYVAQIAAIIGREFSYKVLRRVTNMEESELRSSLNQLIDAGMVYQADVAGDEVYLFKHSLIQDAAYQSLLKKTRRELHAQIGDALGTFPNVLSTQPALLAQHYTAAQKSEEAVPLWIRAVRQAMERAAYYEVAAHCRSGLESVRWLPEEERLQPETQFIMAIIPALQNTVGWSSGELQQYYDRSAELAQTLNAPSQRFSIVSQTFASRFTQGHCREALKLAEQLPPIAETLNRPLTHYYANLNLMTAQVYEGQFVEALASSERAMSYVTPELDERILKSTGMSGQSRPHTYRAEILWGLGYPDQAMEESLTARANARAINHLASMAHAVGDATHFLPHYNDPDMVLACADEALQIERAQRSTWWGPYVGVYQGWALTMLGRHAEGINLMRQSLDRFLKSRSGTCQSHMRACLATGLMRAQRWPEAHAVLREARTVMEEIGERYFETEIYRLEAEVLLNRAIGSQRSLDLRQAQTQARHAFELAASREAKSYELRAAMTLCRISREAGGLSEAHALLRDVYNWFTEGFETSDLIEARNLLTEMDNRSAP